MHEFVLKFTKMKFCQLIASYVVLFLLWESGMEAREIHISSRGNDSSDCSRSKPCKTLDHGFTVASKSDSARLMLDGGSYTLNKPHSFLNMTTFGIHGTGNVTITCGDANVSLSFVLCNNINIERVTLQRCGGWYTSTYIAHKYFPKLQGALFKTALYFRYCRNIGVSGVEISNSPGLGANLYDVGGVINFTNCVFANNSGLHDDTFDTKSKFVHSGGGIFLMLNPYINNTLNVSSVKHNSYQHNNNYLFSNCVFLGNTAQWYGNEIQELYTPARPFTLGGGLAVFFESNASGCSVKIQGCKFRNNKALWGGGLQVEFRNFSENNTVLIESTLFSDNSAASAGGGVRIGNLARKSGVPLTPNRVYLINCSFTKNSAFWGGGASIYGTTILGGNSEAGMSSTTQFHFSNCKWQYNNGSVGTATAIYLYNYSEDQLGPEAPFHVQFDNGTLFESNEVLVHKQNVTIGQGSLYSSQVPLIFKDYTKFLSNQKSALLLDGSFLDVHDQVDFINNTGYRGGAIAMYGRSRIIFYPKANVNFERNTCDDKGGALYIQTPGPPLVSFNQTGTNVFTCFFGYESKVDYQKWNINITFKDNKCSGLYAGQCKGKSVYATTLKICYRVGENRTNNSVLKWKFVKFDTNVSSAVSTDPVELRFDESNWNVAPGEWFDVDVKLLDELSNAVQGIVLVTVNTTSDVSHGKVTIYNHTSCSFLTNDAGKITRLFLKGYERSSFSLYLNCIGSQLLRYKINNVTLRNCYDGFVFNKTTRQCHCMKSTTNGGNGISRCEDGSAVFIKRGFWAGRAVEGKNNTTNFTTYICPEGYCNETLVWNSKASDYKYVKNRVCTKGRDPSSVLCGKCLENYSVVIGGEKCSSKCSDWWLFLIIPAYGVGFLLVVVVIMLIDLDVFTGYFNAWLYSYQVMNLLVPADFQFNPASKFLMDLSNIRVQVSGRSFCFASGIDDADKLMIMYAIPVYVIVVVIILAKLFGAYPQWCFSRRVKAPFRGICTIFVLCYTDITSISLKILRYAYVGSRTVLYANGNIDYFKGKHLGYGIVAILVILLFVIPIPTILLFRGCLTKCLRPVLNLNRWNPFFNAFQSCFKDKYRWCAAFYFISRLIILIIYTMMSPGPVKRLLLEGVCVLIVLFLAFLKPYKEAADVEEDEENYEWMNKSDVALLTTLAFITMVSSPLDYSGSTTPPEMKVVKILLNVLSFVPVAVLLAVGASTVWNHLCHGDPEDELPPMSTSDSREATPVHTPESSMTLRGSGVSRNTSTEHSSLLRRAQKPSARYGSQDSRYQTAEE